jgi:hypothetical protein
MNNDAQINSEEEEERVDESEGEEVVGINNDLIKKFDNLSNIEDSMKRLNDILDYSTKSSLKFKYDYDFGIENNDKQEDKNSFLQYEKEENDEDSERMRIMQKHQNYLDEANTSSSNNNKLSQYKENKKNQNKFENEKKKIITDVEPQYHPKKAQIIRKVINIDEERCLNNENELLDTNKKDEDDLAYLKNILMQTKKDIDSFNNNIKEPNNYNGNNKQYNYNIDMKMPINEEEPRQPPKTLLSSYKTYK